MTLSNGGFIECVRVTNLKVQGLTFVPPTEKPEGKQGKPNFNLLGCYDAVFSELVFLGSGVTGNVLTIQGSNVSIANCTFDRNVHASSVVASGSNISLTASKFSGNKDYSGSAVHIEGQPAHSHWEYFY